MPCPYLHYSDSLPAVGVLQRVLQARVDPNIECDGHYGPETTRTVRTFQRDQRLGVDGIVGQRTWPALIEGVFGLEVADCIDVFDPSLYELEARPRSFRQPVGTSVASPGTQAARSGP